MWYNEVTQEVLEAMAGDPTRDGVPERVVQATIRLLAEQGPSAIKARTVASASGLSTMAVYHHFGGIAELMGAVADHGLQEFDHEDWGLWLRRKTRGDGSSAVARSAE